MQYLGILCIFKIIKLISHSLVEIWSTKDRQVSLNLYHKKMSLKTKLSYLSVRQHCYHDSQENMFSESKRVTNIKHIDVILEFRLFDCDRFTYTDQITVKQCTRVSTLLVETVLCPDKIVVLLTGEEWRGVVGRTMDGERVGDLRPLVSR